MLMRVVAFLAGLSAELTNEEAEVIAAYKGDVYSRPLQTDQEQAYRRLERVITEGNSFAKITPFVNFFGEPLRVTGNLELCQNRTKMTDDTDVLLCRHNFVLMDRVDSFGNVPYPASSAVALNISKDFRCISLTSPELKYGARYQASSGLFFVACINSASDIEILVYSETEHLLTYQIPKRTEDAQVNTIQIQAYHCDKSHADASIVLYLYDVRPLSGFWLTVLVYNVHQKKVTHHYRYYGKEIEGWPLQFNDYAVQHIYSFETSLLVLVLDIVEKEDFKYGYVTLFLDGSFRIDYPNPKPPISLDLRKTRQIQAGPVKFITSLKKKLGGETETTLMLLHANRLLTYKVKKREYDDQYMLENQDQQAIDMSDGSITELREAFVYLDTTYLIGVNKEKEFSIISRSVTSLGTVIETRETIPEIKGTFHQDFVIHTSVPNKAFPSLHIIADSKRYFAALLPKYLRVNLSEAEVGAAVVKIETKKQIVSSLVLNFKVLSNLEQGNQGELSEPASATVGIPEQRIPLKKESLRAAGIEVSINQSTSKSSDFEAKIDFTSKQALVVEFKDQRVVFKKSIEGGLLLLGIGDSNKIISLVLLQCMIGSEKICTKKQEYKSQNRFRKVLDSIRMGSSVLILADQLAVDGSPSLVIYSFNLTNFKGG